MGCSSGHDSLDFDSDYFDIVLLIGTIEHVADPRTLLSEIYRVLKSGGILVITTIDTRGIIPLYHLKPPEHLFYFNHNNLMMLLEQEGYRYLLRETHMSIYFLFEVFNILSQFRMLSFFKFLGTAVSKAYPDFSLRLPTNEMLLIVQKQ